MERQIRPKNFKNMILNLNLLIKKNDKIQIKQLESVLDLATHLQIGSIEFTRL